MHEEKLFLVLRSVHNEGQVVHWPLLSFYQPIRIILSRTGTDAHLPAEVTGKVDKFTSLWLVAGGNFPALHKALFENEITAPIKCDNASNDTFYSLLIIPNHGKTLC